MKPGAEWELSEEGAYAREPRILGEVVIIGVGAVGSNLAVLLADIGFKPLYLVDHGLLKVGNLPRHALGAQDIGQPKARALEKRLGADSPWCGAEGVDEDFLKLTEAAQVKLLSKAALVVAATDSSECQQRINELCVRNQITALYPGVWADDGVRDGEVGALLQVVPGEGTPCYRCYTDWRGQQAGEVIARGGSGLDIKEFANAVASAAIGLFEPDHERAEAFDPEQTLTLFHTLSSVSPGIAHLFRDGKNPRHLRIPFPRKACPICGGQEPNPASPGSQVGLAGIISRLAPDALANTDFRHISRGSWLLATLAVLLISLRVESATGMSPRRAIGADVWNVGVLLAGLCGAAWPRRAADRSEELRALVSAAVAVMLLLVTAVAWKVLPSGHGAPNPPTAGSQAAAAPAAFTISSAGQFPGAQGQEVDQFGDIYTLTISARYTAFTVHLSLRVSYDPASGVDRNLPQLLLSSAHSCLETQFSYNEHPFAVSLKRPRDGLIVGTMTFAAVFPGSYNFNYLCRSGDPLNIGWVTIKDSSELVPGFTPSVVTDSSGGDATIIFSIGTSDLGGVGMLFGAVGKVSGSAGPGGTCLSTNENQNITPSSVSVTHSGSGNGQFYKVGMLTFDLPSSDLGASDIFYNCSTETDDDAIWIPEF